MGGYGGSMYGRPGMYGGGTYAGDAGAVQTCPGAPAPLAKCLKLRRLCCFLNVGAGAGYGAGGGMYGGMYSGMQGQGPMGK